MTLRRPCVAVLNGADPRIAPRDVPAREHVELVLQFVELVVGEFLETEQTIACACACDGRRDVERATRDGAARPSARTS